MSEPSDYPKRRGNPLMVKGGPSLNPRGRPRTGLALAEKIRERLSPDLLVDLAERLAGDETLSLEKRVAALMPVYQAGYLRPPTTAAVHMTGEGDRPAGRDWSRLTLDQRRVLLELHRAAAVPALSDGSEP